MVSLTWAVIAVIVYSIYRYFKNSLDYFKNRDIPYYPSAWPVFGNMASAIFKRKHINQLIKDIYDYNPDAKYIGLFDFVRPVICIRDLEIIKDMAIKNFESFMDHKPLIDSSLDPLFGATLFNITGEKWKETRSLLTPAFSSSKIRGMFEFVVGSARNFAKYLEERSDSENNMIATKDLFTKYTNDVIATCVFGVNVDSFSNPTNDFYTFGKEATSIEGAMLIKLFVSRAFPNIMKIFRIKFVREEIVQFFKSIVSSTIATREETSTSRPDIIQLMMNARGKAMKHAKLDLMEITSQAFVFFFGGFDTTSSQMCVIAHHLTIYPDVQRKLQAEIDQVLMKHDGELTYNAISDMAYLDAVFIESMRLHTLVGFLDRVCTKSYQLPPALPGGKPFTIEPGMGVWIPVSGIHVDPKYYDNPEIFNPERYYKKKVSINDVTNLGFGIGPRACIGNRFALMAVKIMLVVLLSKFNFVANDRTTNPFVYSSKHSFSAVPQGGFWLGIEKRT